MLVHYHLGRPSTSLSVAASLVPPHFDARYPPQNLSIQIPSPHLLETLQVPGTSQYHIAPPQPQIDFGLHHQPVFDLAVEPSHIQPPPALSPAEEYTFNLPQSRYSEQQLRFSYEPPPAPSRSSFAMASNEAGEQQPHTPSATGSASGSNPTSGPTRPPRREASTQVIACRQWYVR